MARSFLKIYFDFDEKTDELTDNEKGRLLLAMLRYAMTAQKPVLTGNERFLFSAFKSEIDRDIATYNAKIANGNLGGRPAMEKPNETENNLTKPNVTEHNLNAKNKNKNKEQEERKRVSKETQNAREAMFEQFWVSYPRHTNKKAALQAFLRVNPDEALMQAILAAIEKQRQSAQWTKDGGQFIPHPATWLNGRRWEDEMPSGYSTNKTKTVSAQAYTQREYTEDELAGAAVAALMEEARRDSA